LKKKMLISIFIFIIICSFTLCHCLRDKSSAEDNNTINQMTEEKPVNKAGKDTKPEIEKQRNEYAEKNKQTETEKSEDKKTESASNKSGSSANSNSASSPKNSNTSSDNKQNKSEKKERTVTIKYPVYGEMYTVYWIKDDSGKVIYETKDANEWEHILSTPDNDIYYKADSYGSGGKQDIICYESFTYTESEYNDRIKNSDLGKRTDVIINWNLDTK